MNFVFILLSSTIYFGVHAFLYFSTLHFFGITDQRQEIIVLIIYLALAFGFIISLIISRYSSFIVFKFFYVLTAFWFALAVYLFLAFILGWVFVLMYPELKLLMGVMVIGASLIISFFGVYQGLHTVIKPIEVSLKDLPDTWKGQAVVHISDLHLGDINSVIYTKRIVRQINKINPKAIFITGDLFDGIGSDLMLYLQALEKLECPHIYYILGNHEIYLGKEMMKESFKDSKIKILDNQLVNLEGVQIIGLTYPEHNFNFPEYNPDQASILLSHEPIGLSDEVIDHSSLEWRSYLSPNMDFSLQKERRIDLQLSGHTHQGQFFPFDFIAQKIFKGYHYGLFKDEDFHLYVSSGAGTWGPPLRIGSKSEIVKIKLK